MANRTEVILHLHDYLPSSRSNGPGNRAVLWLQGCTLACPGCFNPDTHAQTGGVTLSVAETIERICAITPAPDGITISGGEPLQQMPALLVLLQELQTQIALPIILFSGYTYKEIQLMPEFDELTSMVDVLITGRYQSQNRLATGLRGSSNKTLHFFSNRLNFQDFLDIPETEIILTPTGEVIMSGIDPFE